MSVLSSPLPHNHLTPLRSSAEASFTPLSSLQLQVLLALTRWPLSNQHLLGFIPFFPSCFHHFPISPLRKTHSAFSCLRGGPPLLFLDVSGWEKTVLFLLCYIYFVKNWMRIYVAIQKINCKSKKSKAFASAHISGKSLCCIVEAM